MSMRFPLYGVVAGTLTVSALLALFVYFDAHQQLFTLLQWVHQQGAWGALLFIAMMAAVVLLLLPGLPFTTGAGFIFGVVEGSVYVVLGTTLGASLAFLISRYLFAKKARNFIIAHARLRVVSDELVPQGWKVVLLTRLIPFFPGKLSNYFFGLTPFSLRGYVGGSLVGFTPFSIHNVYLGSLVADITRLGEQQFERSALTWALYGTGFVATVFTVIYLNRIARRALARYSEQGLIEEDPSP